MAQAGRAGRAGLLAILVIAAACDAPTAPGRSNVETPGAPADPSAPADPGPAPPPAAPNAPGPATPDSPAEPEAAPPEPPPPAPPPPPPPSPPPPPDTATPLEDEVLALVNQRRAAGASCGGTAYGPAPALYMHPSLRAAARGHSEDMAASNYFSHTSLDGRTFDQRIRQAGYTGAFPLGENIAGGPATARAVVDGWMNSPGHCVNIMSPGFRALGVGYAFNPASTYRHYWTQSFGGS